jgi:hypothetical protein
MGPGGVARWSIYRGRRRDYLGVVKLIQPPQAVTTTPSTGTFALKNQVTGVTFETDEEVS